MEKPDFVVAHGKSITSKKGVIGPGAAVEASFFVHGETTFDALKTSGHIVSWADYMTQLHLLGVKDESQPNAVTAKITPIEKPKMAIPAPEVKIVTKAEPEPDPEPVKVKKGRR